MRTSTFILGLLAPTFALAANPSKDGSCGGYKGYSCRSSRFGECCSQHGWCGSSEAYCGKGCNTAFGACRYSVGPLPNPGPPGRPPPPGSPPPTKPPTQDSRCGKEGRGQTCEGSRWGSCCSQYSYCGSSQDYCNVKTCQKGFGRCDLLPSSSFTTKSSTKTTMASSSVSLSKSASSSSIVSSSMASSSSVASSSTSPSPSAVCKAQGEQCNPTQPQSCCSGKCSLAALPRRGPVTVIIGQLGTCGPVLSSSSSSSTVLSSSASPSPSNPASSCPKIGESCNLGYPNICCSGTCQNYLGFGYCAAVAIVSSSSSTVSSSLSSSVASSPTASASTSASPSPSAPPPSCLDIGVSCGTGDPRRKCCSGNCQFILGFGYCAAANVISSSSSAVPSPSSSSAIVTPIISIVAPIVTPSIISSPSPDTPSPTPTPSPVAPTCQGAGGPCGRAGYSCCAGLECVEIMGGACFQRLS